MKSLIKQGLIGVGMIVLMSFLFLKSSGINSDVNNEFEQDLRRLKGSEATLDKSVVESRYGIQTTYDLLIAENDEIGKIEERLKNVPHFLENDKQAEIRDRLSQFQALQSEKEGLIDEFVRRILEQYPPATAKK